MGAVRTSHPRFKREGQPARIELTDDDIAILRHVYRHRFVRADDLYRLFPNRSPDKLSRRLVRLYRNQFLDRPIAQVDRFHEGGSQPLVYGLYTAGARFLKETFDVPLTSIDWKARNRSYTRDNLDHTLAIAHFMIGLELAIRARPNMALLSFEDILADAPERTQRQVQPGKWPVELRWLGTRGVVQIAPDAIFGIRTEDGTKTTRTYIFLEMDRGTMTIAPAKQVRESDAFLYRATILRKFVAFAESYRQDLHKSHLGISATRTLFITTTKARAEAMRQAAEEYVVGPRQLPAGLFLFCVPGTENPLSTKVVDTFGQPTYLIRPTTSER